MVTTESAGSDPPSAQDRDMWRDLVRAVMNIPVTRIIKVCTEYFNP